MGNGQKVVTKWHINCLKMPCFCQPAGIMWTAGMLYTDAQMAQWVASKAEAAAADLARRKALEDDPRLPLVYLDVALKGVPLGRIVMVLFADTSPLAAENLRALCTGK